MHITNLRRRMSLRVVIIAIVVGIIIPVLLSTSLGIITLIQGESSDAILLGVLTISFAAAAIGGAVTAAVLIGRRARLARLQADLLANVTHELRTPLTAIRMYSQTLQMGRVAGDPKRTRECVATILRETEWLETRIDSILTWRGASQDWTRLDLALAPLRAAIEDAVTRFERMPPPDEVELTVDIETEQPIPHDRTAVASIVLNLLVNAYKYTGREKRIAVALEDRGERLELSVEDNGIGIAPGEHSRIFDPFYRVDTRQRSRAGGAGLGLAIVRHQVRAHRGEVYIESEPGQGTRFAVRFPLAPEGATSQ
jgi:two-component system, OmpR family, phosphate regulon sensor histidine kinase PhoR